MAKTASKNKQSLISDENKLLTTDFISGLLLGFLITFYLLFIIKPMLMPSPAVAPVKNLDR